MFSKTLNFFSFLAFYVQAPTHYVTEYTYKSDKYNIPYLGTTFFSVELISIC